MSRENFHIGIAVSTYTYNTYIEAIANLHSDLSYLLIRFSVKDCSKKVNTVLQCRGKDVTDPGCIKLP